MHRYPISNNRSNQSQYFPKKFYIIGKTFYFYRSTALKNTHIKLKMYKFITGMSNFFIFSSSICFLSSKVLTKNCHIYQELLKSLCRQKFHPILNIGLINFIYIMKCCPLSFTVLITAKNHTNFIPISFFS